MKQGLWSKFRSLNKSLVSINSYCTLYEEVLKEKIDSELVDEIIIDSKQLFLKYKEIEEQLLNLGL